MSRRLRIVEDGPNVGTGMRARPLKKAMPGGGIERSCRGVTGSESALGIASPPGFLGLVAFAAQSASETGPLDW